MTHELDTRLHDRLARLAEAVPVGEASALAPVVGQVRARTSGRRLALAGFLPILVLIAGGAILAGLAQLGPRGGSGSPAPNGPVADVETAGPFSLELRADRHTYVEGDSIDVQATFRYADGRPPTALLSRSNRLLGFGIEEPVHGMNVITTFESLLSCNLPISRVVEPGSEIVEPFEKGGEPDPGAAAAKAQQAFLDDPVLRLPPGVWHIYAVASLSEVDNGCQTEFTHLQPVIEIEVLPAEPAEATPRASAIEPDGSVSALVDDGTFELSVRSAAAVFVENEMIYISSTFAYVGPDPSTTIHHFGPPVLFSIEQLNATAPTNITRLLDAACIDRDLTRDVEIEERLGFVVRASGDGVDNAWLAAHLDDGVLRLPIGDWRITALFAPSIGSCQGPAPSRSGLAASIDLKVVPTTGRAIDLRTALEPTKGCYAQWSSGRLAVDPRSGLGIVAPDGSVVDVTWPFGFTARLEPSGAVVIGGDGEIVAREGDLVGFTGGPLPDGSMLACGGVTRVED